MNLKNLTINLSAICLGMLLITGCGPDRGTPQIKDISLPQQKAPAMSSQVSLKVGELGPEFAKHYPDLIKTYQSLPGVVQDYDMHWSTRPRGTARIEHGGHSFTIEDVLSIQAAQDLKEYASEGLSEFAIIAGLTVPDLISHDEARLKTYAILQRILQAGWRPTIARSDPRLVGKARLDYVLNVDDTMGLDPLYVPTLEEWMRIGSLTDWAFYADHLYLEVNFTRERTLLEPAKPGAYILSFNVKSEVEYFRGYVGPENRARWKEKLPGELEKLAPIRAKREAELRAKGIKIDETYQDPPVPDLR